MTTAPSITKLPPAGVYTIDPVHSTLGFVVRHLVAAKVRGQFNDFSGTITIGETLDDSKAEVTAQAASITTNNETRDNHLKSVDFLEIETYPTLSFTSTGLTATGADRFELTGDLTIKGVTKSVTFDVEYLGSGTGMAPGSTVAGFEARTEIDRRDFGVNFEGALENGTIVVSNKVTIELAIEASKA
ncbi:MAG: YceI family protein [Acidimicrobiales bacterium]